MMLETLGLASFVFVAVFTARAYTRNSGVGQTPRGAVIEAWVNIVIGFSINMLMNTFMFPLMTNGSTVTAEANFWGGWVYTAASIIRQYAIRRYFNAKIHDISERFSLFLKK
jgi:hypothetical protein